MSKCELDEVIRHTNAGITERIYALHLKHEVNGRKRTESLEEMSPEDLTEVHRFLTDFFGRNPALAVPAVGDKKRKDKHG